MNDFAHEVIVTPSVRPIFIQSVALILPFVILHIPLMQLHLQLRVSGFLRGFQSLVCALEAITGHPAGQQGGNTPLVHTASSGVTKLPQRTAGNALQLGSMASSLYNVASPLACLATRKNPLYKEHIEVARTSFDLFVVAELPLLPMQLLQIFTKLLSSIASIVLALDGARNPCAVALSMRPLLALYLRWYKWEDAAGLVHRLFRNCFPQGLFPRSASQSRKRFTK